MRERKSNRLDSFDYSKDGSYFVTFCAKNREYILGEIIDKEMKHSFLGEIVAESIEWLKEQYSYIRIHEYAIMPDHVHLLIEINRVGTGRDLSLQHRDLSLHIPPKIKSLSELIGALKTVSSKNIRLNGYPDFEWQRSFHDQIIRSPEHFERVKEYIIDNPRRWKIS